jgi:hypothetical protein
MMDKILEINFKSKFGFGLNTDLPIDEPIEGTNGATLDKMNRVNETVRVFMSVAIVPLFGAAGLAILILGERNFFSEQVKYENEPMASIGECLGNPVPRCQDQQTNICHHSIGQWGPIVGTGLAFVGSLYLLLAADMEEIEHVADVQAAECQCKCTHHDSPGSKVLQPTSQAPNSRDSLSTDRVVVTEHQRAPMIEALAGLQRPASTSASSSSLHELETRDMPHPKRHSLATLKRAMTGRTTLSSSTSRNFEGESRHKVAEFLTSVGHLLGTATKDSFDISKFRDGPALDYPNVPGEQERRHDFNRVREIYSQRLEADGTLAVHASRSRASSFVGAGPSGHALGGLHASRDASPQPDLSRSASPVASGSGLARQRASTLPVTERSSYELHPVATLPSGPNGDRGRLRARRDTLEVPAPVQFHPHRYHSNARLEIVQGSFVSPPSPSSPLASPPFIASGSFSEEPATLTDDDATTPSSLPPTHET